MRLGCWKAGTDELCAFCNYVHPPYSGTPGAGKQGRMNCVLSVIMFILPTLAPSFYLPRTTAHWTCAGLEKMKYMHLKGFVLTTLWLLAVD